MRFFFILASTSAFSLVVLVSFPYFPWWGFCSSFLGWWFDKSVPNQEVHLYCGHQWNSQLLSCVRSDCCCLHFPLGSLCWLPKTQRLFPCTNLSHPEGAVLLGRSIGLSDDGLWLTSLRYLWQKATLCLSLDIHELRLCHRNLLQSLPFTFYLLILSSLMSP